MEVVGLEIQIGAKVDGALRAFNDVTKSAGATATAITAAMTKASGSIDKIPVATAKVSVSFDKIDAALAGAFKDAGIGNLISEFETLGTEGAASINKLAATLDILQAAQEKATDPTAFKIYQVAIDEVSLALKELKANTGNVSGGTVTINTQAIAAAILEIDRLETSASAPVKINIIVSQDIQQALAGMEHLSVEIKDLASGGVTSIGQLTNAIKTLKTASLSTPDMGAVSKYNVAIEKLTGEVTRLKGATIPAGGAITAVGKSSNTAAFALQGLGRVAQDLPFGFIGISNNLNPLLEGFQRLQKEAKETGVSIGSLIKSSLTGAGGFGLALSVVSAALTIATIGMGAWTRGFGGAANAVDEATKANDDYVKSLDEINNSAVKGAEKEVASLQTFVAIAQDANASYKQRLDAVVKLQEISPDYFGNLTKEQILYGDLTKEINLSTEALFNKAYAEAASNKAAEAGKKVFDLVEKRKQATAELAAAQEDVNAAVKRGQVVGNLQGDELLKNAGAWGQRVIIARIALNNLNNLFFQAQLDQASFLEDTKKYTLLSGAIDKTGDHVKAIEGIFRDLRAEIDLINKKTIATGVDFKTEKIAAFKKSIEDLLKTNIDLKDIRLTGLINEFKALGGTFEETEKKGKSIKNVATVLAELSRDISLLNAKQVSFGTDEIPNKIKAIESAINKLRDLKVPAESTVIQKLFGDIKDLQADEALRQIPEILVSGLKLLTPVKIPIPVEVKPVTKLEPFLSGEAADRALLIAQVTKNFKDLNIAVPVNIKVQNNVELDSEKVKTDAIKAKFRDALEQIKGDFSSGIFEAIGAGIGDALSGAGFAGLFKGIFRILGEAMKQLGKVLIETSAAVTAIKTIFKTPALAPLAIPIGIGLIALGTLIENKIGNIKTFGEGGIVTGPTFGIFGEKGTEIIMPLDRLRDFIKPNDGFPDFLPRHQISGDNLILWYERAVLKRGRTF